MDVNDDDLEYGTGYDDYNSKDDGDVWLNRELIARADLVMGQLLVAVTEGPLTLHCIFISTPRLVRRRRIVKMANMVLVTILKLDRKTCWMTKVCGPCN